MFINLLDKIANPLVWFMLKQNSKCFSYSFIHLSDGSCQYYKASIGSILKYFSISMLFLVHSYFFFFSLSANSGWKDTLFQTEQKLRILVLKKVWSRIQWNEILAKNNKENTQHTICHRNIKNKTGNDIPCSGCLATKRQL